MSRTLSVRSRQRVRRVNTPLLRRITLHVLNEQLCIDDFELAIHLVAAPEMSEVNWNFLQHEGSTDVITFDHSVKVGQASSLSRTGKRPAKRPCSTVTTNAADCRDRLEACPTLHGEIYVCLDDAVKQAREFRTTWQGELIRYVIHGLLHLCGHDDLKPAARRKMKREEERMLRRIAGDFSLSRLETRNPKRGTRQSAIGNPQSAI